MRCDCQLPAKTCQHSSNLAPTWPNLAQLGSNLVQLGPNLAPTCSQLGATWPQIGPKITQVGPTWPHPGHNMAPTGPNRDQLGSKLVPKLTNLASTWSNLVLPWLSQFPSTWPQLASQFVTTWRQLAYNRHHHPTHICMKRVGLFHGLHKRHTMRKAWPLQWTTQAQRCITQRRGRR